MKHNPIVLAIDPGYDRLGWAVGRVNGPQAEVIEFGCLETDKQAPLLDRFQAIQHQVQTLVTEHHIQELALETLFFNKNVTTGMAVAEVRGLLIGIALDANLDVFQYTPSQIKSTVTGNGKASKQAMTKMITMQLKVNTKGVKDDAIDALGVLITHAASRKLAIL